MRRLRRFLRRLSASLTRRRDDDRLREDLADHIALQTDDNIRAGMSAAEARRQALLSVQVLGDQLDDQFSAVRAARTMFVVFGGLALLLSAIGLYAALAFLIGERTREIGVRIALGASRADVGRLVFRRGTVIFGGGALAGLAACVFAGPLLAHLLYGVGPRDPIALLAGPLVLAVVAVLAIWLPARRAMRVDPVAALRAE
jgi:putative ABC transport system permease protein